MAAAASSGDAPLLDIRRYRFSFPVYPGLPERELFRGLSFQLNPGEFHVLLGRPGAGKTTLSRCLAALYPGPTQARSEGEILLSGEEADRRSACDWIDQVALLFQDPDEQIVTARCDDEAAFALESQGFPPEEIARRMDRAFREFGVSWPRDRNPLSLSGGEKKRLLLACLRMQDAALWILDEPLDELDAPGREALLAQLSDLARREKRGILLLASKFHRAFDRRDIRLSLLKDGLIVPLPPRGEREPLLASQGLVPPPPRPAAEVIDRGSPEAKTPLLEIRRASYAYPEGRGFSLEIENFRLLTGETLLLTGPNGCGKSTLARLLCGLLLPDRGELLLEGRPADREALNRSCGYLFQNPDYQLFLPTVAEELELGLKRAGIGRKERRARAARQSERFRLPGPEAPPSLLSFGGRKRLQGAIYSLLTKKLYILDEADSGLNYEDYGLLTAELQKKESALIIISHNRELPPPPGARSLAMKAGRLCAAETPEAPA